MPLQQLSQLRARSANFGATAESSNFVLTLRAVLLVGLAAIAGLAGLSGCVYRPDIQQGNFLETKDVDQVTVGMTRSQVRYVLGTPLVEAPFDNARWDYVFFRQKGRLSRAERRHFVVYFEDDKVVRVDRPILPAS